jgi:hypothetical protein
MQIPHHPWQSVRAAANTATFILKVLPMLPSRPLNWVTKQPVVERVQYPGPHGLVAGELYRPGGTGPHPGVVVCLGVVPFGVDHPQVPRLGEALARAGVAALLYWSPVMRDLRLDPVDIDGIAEAYAWLIDRPSIDAKRSGLIGTCVGGSFALMAAAHPAIRDRVGFVAAWAPYADMRSFARDIASASTTRKGIRSNWEVDQLTRKVFVRSLTATLDADEAEQLRSQCAERAGSKAPSRLSKEGAALYALLTALDDQAASDVIDALPDGIQRRLDQLSPLSYTDQIRAPTILLATTTSFQSASRANFVRPSMIGAEFATPSSSCSSTSTQQRCDCRFVR